VEKITPRLTPPLTPDSKKATEAYWAGKISADELQKVAKEQRAERWQTLKAQGVDVIPS
jgi:5-methyltetrahydropteroyltriglutamate--homocysteine methyltransferase